MEKVWKRRAEKLIRASGMVTGVIALIAGCCLDTEGYFFLNVWIISATYSIVVCLHTESRDDDV